MFGVVESLQWRFAVAIPSAMWPLLIVVNKPFIQIGLQLLERLVNLLSESDLIELLENCLVETLADSVGLRALGSCLRVIDILDRQEELVFVVLSVPAILCATVSEDSQ